MNLSLLCRLFGHKIRRAEAFGISPKSLKIVHRIVHYCERCGKRSHFDIPVRDFDMKEGINLWGSAGVCSGCKNMKACEHSSYQLLRAEKVPIGSFEHCPIKNFVPSNEAEFRKELKNWGDTLIDLRSRTPNLFL